MTKQGKQVTEQTLTLSSISDLLDRKLEEKLEEKLEQKLEEKLEQKLTPIIVSINGLKQDVGELKSDVNGLKQDVGELKEDMDIVKEFLTTQVMTKADGREIMTIVNRHTKEIKELQAMANY